MTHADQLEFPRSVIGSTSRGDHVTEAIRYIERDLGVPARIRKIAGVVRIYPNPAFVPSRIVTREEAVARNWPSYYIATPCLNNHLAPRWTHGFGCIDCDRAKRGKSPIGIQLVAPDDSSANPASADSAQSSDQL